MKHRLLVYGIVYLVGLLLLTIAFTLSGTGVIGNAGMAVAVPLPVVALGVAVIGFVWNIRKWLECPILIVLMVVMGLFLGTYLPGALGGFIAGLL